jgi:uncharacterized protein YbjT (DUF2867 family)
MSREAMHAVLFGATGLIGGELLPMLLASPRMTRVTAVTRRPLALRAEKLVNVISDMQSPALPAGIERADVAFSCLGTTMKQAGSKEAFYAVDHDLCLRSAQWSRQLGVHHFLVVTAMGASVASPVYYNRVKGEAEKDLEKLGFARLTIMQPSLLLGERGGPSRPGEAVGIALAPLFAPLMAGPLSPYRPVRAGMVAAAMLAAACTPSAAAVERLRWRDFAALTAAR